jgi:hypothetical protein
VVEAQTAFLEKIAGYERYIDHYANILLIYWLIADSCVNMTTKPSNKFLWPLVQRKKNMFFSHRMRPQFTWMMDPIEHGLRGINSPWKAKEMGEGFTSPIGFVRQQVGLHSHQNR